METIKARTDLIDDFLEKHGVTLPTHVIDFALDARSMIVELEELLEGQRQPVAVG